jgi:hypothetical protein
MGAKRHTCKKLHKIKVEKKLKLTMAKKVLRWE